ncbi:helicase-related protein, partial [uncultured Thiodictyon sp.]|uniref:helicase-related protein n=1 Tax=uncultured Thiodictyon sp. TaxID=1846217 RepID=UPI0025CF5003
DGPTLRYCIEETHLDGVWPQKYARAILPYSLLDEALLMGDTERRRPRRGLLGLDPPPTFDLVIVDVAHHIRNTETWAYRAARWFCDNAEAVVLLSATPIQLGDPDLYTLLHLLRPDLLPSRREYEQMAEPNPYINAAIESVRGAGPDWRGHARVAMQAAIATPWGRNVLTADPRTQTAHDLLDTADPTPDERLTLVGLLEGLYTFSPLINRTRRRDIGNFTTRKPETVAVDYTPEQQALHTDLIQLIGAMLARRHGDRNLRFMLTTVHRQLASCVFGLAPYLEAILDRHLSQLELSEIGDEDSPDALSDTFDQFRAEVQSIVQRARALNGPDPKLAAFLKVIHDKQALPNNKLLVFSSFRHTLAYLIAKLADQPVRTGLIHGDIPEEDRRDLRNRFSLPKEDPTALDLLLSSEVGCEGLDYQFCDGLVNYDLPWNPMRVEQRIGRIDRYGQKSETVAIYNFITPGTVDAEIYERCLLRIGVFRQALGGSEEILGRLTREIREIAENLTLTPAEQAARLQQIADNEIRVIQEQTRLEEQQAKLFGLALPKRDEEMVRQAASFWLRPPMLANLIARYLESRGAVGLPKSFGSKPVTTLQLGQEVRDKLLADFKTLKLTGTVAQAWERWLKGNDPRLAITFDQATADEQRLIAFITPMHPLARQAAEAEEPAAVLTCNLTAQTNVVPPGRYPFAIYRWRRIGLKDDFTFQPICLDPRLNEHILEFLEAAISSEPGPNAIAIDEESALEEAHYRLWSNSRAQQIEQVINLARAQIASLDATHAARVLLLNDQFNTATDARIRRMREAQIAAATRDYERRRTALSRAADFGEILAEPVVVGLLELEGC